MKCKKTESSTVLTSLPQHWYTCFCRLKQHLHFPAMVSLPVTQVVFLSCGSFPVPLSTTSVYIAGRVLLGLQLTCGPLLLQSWICSKCVVLIRKFQQFKYTAVHATLAPIQLPCTLIRENCNYNSASAHQPHCRTRVLCPPTTMSTAIYARNLSQKRRNDDIMISLSPQNHFWKWVITDEELGLLWGINYCSPKIVTVWPRSVEWRKTAYCFWTGVLSFDQLCVHQIWFMEIRTTATALLFCTGGSTFAVNSWLWGSSCWYSGI